MRSAICHQHQHLLGQVFMCPMSQEAAAVAHADEERLVADLAVKIH